MRIRSLGSDCWLPRPNSVRDPVAELLRELLVADAGLAGQRLLLRERVDGNVVEALGLHAVADPVLDPALDLLGAVAAEAERVLELHGRLVSDLSSPPQPATTTAAIAMSAIETAVAQLAHGSFLSNSPVDSLNDDNC